MTANEMSNIIHTSLDTDRFRRGQALEFLNGVWCEAIFKTEGVYGGNGVIYTGGSFNGSVVIGLTSITTKEILIRYPPF